MTSVSKRDHIKLISSTIQTFDRQMTVWRLILYLSIVVTALPISEANSTCTVNGIHYICISIATKTDFPRILPTNVQKVTLKGTNELERSFPGERFTHHTWATVTELSILEFTNIESIDKWFLNGLEELKVISISSCTHLKVIDRDTFNFTPNIEELHLDGNTRLNLSIVEAALVDKLNSLKYLSLIGIQNSENHIVLGDNFLKALHGKNISYLDISGVNVIVMENAVAQDVLANLKYLNLSYSKVISPSGMDHIYRSLMQNIGFWILLVYGILFGNIRCKGKMCYI
ncbi:hypothetical protein ACJMK2_000696 [Sinanodonta woodiana]|uniref:Uncharacterized protein n=1 Tax=Sinanodonta woodiana TaxID=1069815 RepID=A0ABD3XRT2_SINWO